MIDSILKAIEKGKIKVRKVDDNTAGKVEILVHLTPGVSSDKTLDALYAFTDCEVNISPNCCVIDNKKPHFLSVSKVLKKSVDNTLALLRKELEIQRDETLETLHFASLEKSSSRKVSIKTSSSNGLTPWMRLASTSTNA